MTVQKTTAIEVVKAFCQSWFEQCDAEKAISFLAEDVGFIGTGIDEIAQGKKEMAEYIQRDIREITEPFHSELQVLRGQQIAEQTVSRSAELFL